MKVSDQTELFELVYSRQNNIYVIGEAMRFVAQFCIPPKMLM